MERLTIPDVRVDEHTTRRSVIDVAAVREHTMKIYWRLKAYEDTGLTPEEIKAPFTEDTMINLAAQALGVEPSRLRELAEADKDGRVVVLPCKGYSDVDIVRDGVSYRPDHWNIHLTAYAHEQNTPSGLKVGLFDIGEVERAMQEMEGKKDG
jgi:hypothetical protein